VSPREKRVGVKRKVKKTVKKIATVGGTPKSEEQQS